MEEECYLCRCVGRVQFLSQNKVWNVLFDGYEYDSTKDHEHKRRQTGKLSASIVIAENAQVHRDQQAFFSNEKDKTNFISLLTTHLRGIGHQVEVSCGESTCVRRINVDRTCLRHLHKAHRVNVESTCVRRVNVDRTRLGRLHKSRRVLFHDERQRRAHPGQASTQR